MQEDIQKNFILLSKVAKEKKYAQEYLGLLARRGDLGSVRIGKRWYTTWAWFEEFLENSQKKKEVVSEVKVTAPIVAKNIAAEEIPSIESKEEKIKINIPFVFPEREKVMASLPAMEMGREEKIAAPAAVETLAGKPERIAIAVKTKTVEVRKNFTGDIRAFGTSREIREARTQPEIAPVRNFAPVRRMQPILQDEPRLRSSAVEEKNKYAIPYQEMKLKKKADIFSPDLSGEENMQVPVFPRFAFAVSFAIVVLLVAASGYFVWSGGLLTKGTVAGASDERNVGFSSITSGGDHVITSAGDKMKESLSISRVMVQVAKQRVIQDNPVN